MTQSLTEADKALIERAADAVAAAGYNPATASDIAKIVLRVARQEPRVSEVLTEEQDARRWLARQLLDFDSLTDAEAFGVVAYHPSIKEARPSAALTPPTKQEEGAVAWRWRNPGNDWNYQCDRQRIPNVEMEPLYLHPAPSSSGWREEAARVAVSVERGLQGMAVYASAPMDLWDRFSNDVLKLIALAKEPRNG